MKIPKTIDQAKFCCTKYKLPLLHFDYFMPWPQPLKMNEAWFFEAADIKCRRRGQFITKWFVCWIENPKGTTILFQSLFFLLLLLFILRETPRGVNQLEQRLLQKQPKKQFTNCVSLSFFLFSLFEKGFVLDGNCFFLLWAASDLVFEDLTLQVWNTRGLWTW